MHPSITQKYYTEVKKGNTILLESLIFPTNLSVCINEHLRVNDAEAVIYP